MSLPGASLPWQIRRVLRKEDGDQGKRGTKDKSFVPNQTCSPGCFAFDISVS
jgi:hypothetical protein